VQPLGGALVVLGEQPLADGPHGSLPVTVLARVLAHYRLASCQQTDKLV
jgi:hypothetical protein